MSDAYYPADDIGMMARGQAAVDRDRHGAAWRETRAFARERVLTQGQSLAYRDACAANGVKFTEHEGDARTMALTRANHCAQARAGYFYCASTRDDPCGYAPGHLHPHDECTAERCLAGEA
jgi:hypothetical protein